MMVVSEDSKTNSNDIIVYRPKPKNICKKNNTKASEKTKNHHIINESNNIFDLDLRKNKNSKSMNFELISFEEIEKDFQELKARSLRVKGQNELLMLLEKTTKNSSFNEGEKKIKKIERPKKIIYKSINEYM